MKKKNRREDLLVTSNEVVSSLFSFLYYLNKRIKIPNIRLNMHFQNQTKHCGNTGSNTVSLKYLYLRYKKVSNGRFNFLPGVDC